MTDVAIAESGSPRATPAAGGDAVARLGVVLVAHARTDFATRCVETLPASLPPSRVVVVVNEPGLAEASALDALRRVATVVSPPTPRGYGANVNLGVSALPEEVEYLLLANDDVEFLDGSAAKLLETLENDARVGVVGPALRQTHGKQPPLQPQFPTPLRAGLNMTALPLGPLWGPLSRRAGLLPSDDPAEIERNGWVIGAAMAVRARAFREVGGFDEDFFLYYEETDFCYRVREAGWRIAWRADAPVLHVHGGSTSGAALENLFFGSERLYFRKRLGPLRAALFEGTLATIFGLSCAYNAAAALIRPATRERRAALLRERWRTRIFLRGRKPHRIDQFAG